MPAGTFSVYWNFQNSGKFTGTPVRQRTKNDLDAHGAFLDLPRLPAESNHNYFRRLQSVLPLRAGPHHIGLIHGITRELGLEEKVGLKISPVSAGGKWLAQSPHVEISATEITLYNRYVSSTDNTIDRTINIFDHGEGYLVSDVISLIQSSEYFVAELGSSMTGQEKSNGLFPGSSAATINKEWVPANTFFYLRNPDILPGTLYFSEKDIFVNELSTVLATPSPLGLTISWAITDSVVRDGEYFVDYERGTVLVKNSASGRGTCRYRYRDFPWYVKWSPIVVYSLRDDHYKDKAFESEIMSNNSSEHGLASSEGVEVLTQVFEKSPCLWGE